MEQLMVLRAIFAVLCPGKLDSGDERVRVGTALAELTWLVYMTPNQRLWPVRLSILAGFYPISDWRPELGQIAYSVPIPTRPRLLVGLSSSSEA